MRLWTTFCKETLGMRTSADCTIAQAGRFRISYRYTHLYRATPSLVYAFHTITYVPAQLYEILYERLRVMKVGDGIDEWPDS